jgi:hypothetical protein
VQLAQKLKDAYAAQQAQPSPPVSSSQPPAK